MLTYRQVPEIDTKTIRPGELVQIYDKKSDSYPIGIVDKVSETTITVYYFNKARNSVKPRMINAQQLHNGEEEIHPCHVDSPDDVTLIHTCEITSQTKRIHVFRCSNCKARYYFDGFNEAYGQEKCTCCERRVKHVLLARGDE